jgi:dolichol-phosphate mannosyltransferase
MKILVATATYNEALNIHALLDGIHHHLPEAQILVIDDHSPDGTGEILEAWKKSHPELLQIIHRSGKQGLGTAHQLAWKTAVEQGFDLLITMDADFSHDPKYLPEFPKLLKDYAYVTGSRYAKGGGLNYGLSRQILSRGANTLARLLLGIKLKESTTSYRGFRRELLVKLLASGIRSEGYSFFFETVYHITGLTRSVAEFPIYFKDRTAGQSKISSREIKKAIGTLFSLFLRRLTR